MRTFGIVGMVVIALVATIVVPSGRLHADTPPALPRAVASAPPRPLSVRVEGVVERVAGETAYLRGLERRLFTVDFSLMEPPVQRLLVPGRSIAVYGDWTPTALVARGVAFDYAGE